MKTHPGHPSAPRARGWLRGDGSGRTEPVPDEVAVAFHVRTLAQLLLVRSHLRLDTRADRFLAGALTGILHGKTPSYLSTVMPNTFRMAPRYVRDFVARTGYEPPERDVFDALAAKLDRLYRQPLPDDDRNRPPRRRPDCRHAAPARPSAPTACRTVPGSSSRRRRTCACSSTATTTGCGPGCWASTPPPSTTSSTPPTAASPTSRSCARSSPTSAPR